MTTINGPAIFLAQFAADIPPYNSLENICVWAKGLGFTGIQIPSWDKRLIDLELASRSKTYADEINGTVRSFGLSITELTSHLQGQLVATASPYDSMFDAFAPEQFHNNVGSRTSWAVEQLKYAAKASRNLGLKAHPTFSGSFLWHTFYPWPQRNKKDVKDAFNELAKRWIPILNEFEETGVDLCYEIHPGEDLHDGITFERFLEATHHHPRVKILFDPSHFLLQNIDYLGFMDIYHPYIRAFHVKDAEFNISPRSGAYGGYQEWIDRPGRFRSLGDGQINFKSIFSKLAQYDYPGWAVLEWECCLKDQDVGAKEGAELIKNMIIKVSHKAFDDFAGTNQGES